MTQYCLKITDYSNPLAVRFKNIEDIKPSDMFYTDEVCLPEGETVISNVTNADQKYFSAPTGKIALPLNNVIVEKNNIKLKDPRELDSHIIYGKIIREGSKIAFEDNGHATALRSEIAQEVVKITHAEDSIDLSDKGIKKLKGTMIAIEGEIVQLLPGDTLCFVDLKNFGTPYRYGITLREKNNEEIVTERSEK